MRSEHVDTVAILRDGVRADDANGTDPEERQRELDKIRAYWPADFLQEIIDQCDAGRWKAPDWRLLVDPTAWREPKDRTPEEVLALYRADLKGRARWPKLDDVRIWAGRVSNHRRPGEAPGQDSLL